MRCRACADQADPLTSNSMNHNQQTSLAGQPDNHEALFVTSVVRVGNRDRKSGSLKTQVASPNATPCFRSFADSFLRSHSKKASRAEQGPSGCLTVLGEAGRKCVANPGLIPISGAVCRNLAVCPRVCLTGQAARSSSPQNG